MLALCVVGFAADKAPRKPVNDYHIKKLGRNKFFKNADYRKVKTFADFAAIAGEKYAKDILEGLTQLGATDLNDAFLAQLKTGVTAVEGEIPYGTAFEWMFYRKNGIVRTMSKPTWEGKDAKGQPAGIPAYLFDFCSQGQRYYMAVPKACLNLSLLRKEAYESICKMVINKQAECATVGETVTIDLSGSQGLQNLELAISPEGATITPAGDMVWTVVFPAVGDYTVTAQGMACDQQIVNCQSENLKVVLPIECEISVDPACNVTGKPIAINAKTGAGELAQLTIKNESGAIVYNQENPNTPISFTAKMPGVYSIEAKTTGECNLVKTAQSQLRLVKPIASPFYVLGEAGFMLAKGTYSSYLYPRLGAGVWLADQLFSLEVLPGAGLSLTDLPFHHFFMIDARLALHPGQGYFGAGIGLSSKVRDAEPGLPTGEWKSDFDLSFAAGYYLTPERNMAVIGEFRLPVAEGVPVKYNHAFQLGFRYIFPIKSSKNPCDQ
jgi:hypothetical protein